MLRKEKWNISMEVSASVVWPVNKPRVSEPACFGAAPAPAPGKREHDFGIFENWLQIV